MNSIDTGDAALQSDRQIVAVSDRVGGVALPIARGEIASTVRDGDDLAVGLASGGEVVLAGFFAAGGTALLVPGEDPGGVDEIGIAPGGGILGATPLTLDRLEGMFGTEAAHTVAAAFGANGTRRRDGTAFAMPGLPEGDGAGIRAPTLIGGLLLIKVVVAACGGGGGGGGGPATSAPLSDDAQTVVDVIETALQGGGGGFSPVQRAGAWGVH